MELPRKSVRSDFGQLFKPIEPLFLGAGWFFQQFIFIQQKTSIPIGEEMDTVLLLVQWMFQMPAEQR